MLLSRFNDKGLLKFQQKLQDMRDGLIVDTVDSLVTDKDLIESVGQDPSEIMVNEFSTRKELANYISLIIKESVVENEMGDTGLWAWLSAVFIDSVCPADDYGRRFPGKDYRHIPSSSWTDYYRHLIRGSYRIYKLFESKPDLASIVLCQKPSKPGDFVEQLASRQERITNPTIIGVANTLYYDGDRGMPKRGASSTKHNPGTLRRYTSVLNQLDLTYDLYSMNHDELFNLLPLEFEACC